MDEQMRGIEAAMNDLLTVIRSRPAPVELIERRRKLKEASDMLRDLTRKMKVLASKHEGEDSPERQALKAEIRERLPQALALSREAMSAVSRKGK